MHYKIVLSERRKQIFLNGKIEVMSRPLQTFEAKNSRRAEGEFLKILNETIQTFEAKNSRRAEGEFLKILNETIGTASADLYEIKEVKK